MSAREEILNGKHDILKNLATKNGNIVDQLFENYLDYARINWNYSAQSGKQTADDLLNGTGGKNVACGTIREGLKLMIRNDLKMTAGNADLNDRFISKQKFKCFDPKVVGNMANPGSAVFNLGCFFTGHFFVESGGKFYDPCLSTTYSTLEEPILLKASTIQNAGIPMYAFGSGRSVIILRQLMGVAVPGFGTTFEVLSPFKDDLKKTLTAQQFTAAKQNQILAAAGVK